ncbi:MAG TPA: DUF4136 domain-containing protein [Chryseolinea sp.]
MKTKLLFVLAIGLVACSSITTSYDYDKTVDFTKYKTYNFTPEALKLGVQELNRERLIAAIDREMTSRGFTKADNPDALIDLLGKMEEKRTATATTSGGGMYGYGRYGYGGGFSTTQVNYNDYTEGTLFINFIDRASEKIVWQGRGTKTLSETATPEKRERNINEGVSMIYQKFPVKPTK